VRLWRDHRRAFTCPFRPVRRGAWSNAVPSGLAWPSGHRGERLARSVPGRAHQHPSSSLRRPPKGAAHGLPGGCIRGDRCARHLGPGYGGCVRRCLRRSIVRAVSLTCSVCGAKWKRLRMVGARPKRCPDCRRSKRVVAQEHLAELTVPVELPPFVPLGPCPCQGCGSPVWWMRWAMPYRGIKKVWCEPDGTPHRCADVEREGVGFLGVQTR